MEPVSNSTLHCRAAATNCLVVHTIERDGPAMLGIFMITLYVVPIKMCTTSHPSSTLRHNAQWHFTCISSKLTLTCRHQLHPIVVLITTGPLLPASFPPKWGTLPQKASSSVGMPSGMSAARQLGRQINTPAPRLQSVSACGVDVA